MEAELSYMLCAATSTNNTRNPNSFVTSYPSCDYRPAAGGNRFATAAAAAAAGEGEIRGYNAVSDYAAHYNLVIASLATPVLADGYQRAGSYDSSSTGTFSLAVESSLQSFSTLSKPRMSPQGQTHSSSQASCLQFNIKELVAINENGLY
jgi:hypothetical protein